MKGKKIKIIATVVLALGGLAFIATQSVGDAEYYVHVEKVMEAPDNWVGKKNLQVHGFVVAGSIKEEIRDQTVYREFQLQNKGRILDVRHSGAKPDTFKGQAEAVVKGTLVREGDRVVLVALAGEPGIMAKCPSKYEGQR